MDGAGFAIILTGVVGFTAGYNVNQKLLNRLSDRNKAWQAISERQGKLIDEQHALITHARDRIGELVEMMEGDNA